MTEWMHVFRTTVPLAGQATAEPARPDCDQTTVEPRPEVRKHASLASSYHVDPSGKRTQVIGSFASPTFSQDNGQYAKRGLVIQDSMQPFARVHGGSCTECSFVPVDHSGAEGSPPGRSAVRPATSRSDLSACGVPLTEGTMSSSWWGDSRRGHSRSRSYSSRHQGSQEGSWWDWHSSDQWHRQSDCSSGWTPSLPNRTDWQPKKGKGKRSQPSELRRDWSRQYPDQELDDLVC